jgi:hypothetical protein
MSVVEKQISQGFAPDGRIFEPPKTNQELEQPRYLAFLGSLIDAEIARSRWWTKAGGIEIQNPCLRYVKNFLRKGRITPLLKDTHDFLPYSYVEKMVGTNPLGAGYFAQPIPQGYVPPALPPSQGQFQPGFGNLAIGGPSPYGSLVGRLALPGEQVGAILTGAENLTQTNVQRGVVELTTLKGHPYRPQQIDEIYVDPTIWQLQKTIFPTYPILPTLLDEIESLLDEARIHTSLISIVDEMHESLIQFRDYADAAIQNVHHMMRESAGRAGYIPRYTQMDLVLLEQLGMARKDREIRQDAKVNPNSRLEEMFAAWLQAQTEEKAELKRMRQEQDAPIITEDTMKAQPVTEIMSDLEGYDGFPGASGYSGFSGAVATTEHEVITASSDERLPNPVIPPLEVAEFACSGCGRTSPTLAGQKAHERHCEAVKKE